MYLSSSIALLLIKIVMGNFGLLGAWKITNLIFDMLSDSRLMHNAFLIAHISQEEVLVIIKSLENKLAGPASIPIKLLKLIPDLILV